MRSLHVGFFLLILIGTGCQNQKSGEQPKAVIPVSDVISQAPAYVNQMVQVDGLVVHVCRESGKRLFLGEDNFKVLASNQIGKFDVDLEGSDIAATGYIREDKIDNNYLDEWEKGLTGNAQVAVKEAVHTMKAEAAGEDETAVETQLKQIKGYREEIAAGTKGYISFYSLEVVTLKEK